MGNALRFAGPFKYPGRSGITAYYYTVLVRDVIIATIRRDSNRWWYMWHNTLIPAKAEEKQAVRDAVDRLNAGEEITIGGSL